MAEGDSAMNFLQLNSTDFREFLGDSSALMDLLPASFGSNYAAELEILEQPKQRGFRFRYSCEGPSHGGLPGEQSIKGKKTYPSVQIVNYVGKARIEVSLVTASEDAQPHAHSLVGKNVRDGACVVEVGPECGMTATFPNLGIQHVTKKNVKSVLKERYLKRHLLEKTAMLGISNGDQGVDTMLNSGRNTREIANSVSQEESSRLDQLVEQEAKNMNLSTVRLCFQAYLPNDEGHFVNCLKPVYSHPVYDSKAAAASELKICRVDKQAGFVQGGEEVFLLCDKVQKDDIEVRFFEEPTEEDVTRSKEPWEAFGKFSTSDVHRQFAIVFKTPEYWNLAIEKPVIVNMELRRKSDNERSAPFTFTYRPQEFDSEQIGAKRRKTIPYFGQSDSSTTSSVNAVGAGASATAEMSSAAAANPALLFNPMFGAGFANVPLPALFPSNPFQGFSYPSGFGASGGESGQAQQFHTSESQEPSSSNLS